MENIFGFEGTYTEAVKYMFNTNHILLVLLVAAFIVTLYFALCSKTEKGKKITKLALAVVLISLELGRIAFRFGLDAFNGVEPNLARSLTIISFQMCAIMTWTTAITLIVSAFKKKQGKVMQCMFNILFGGALVGGVLTFAYPDCIHGLYPLYHFYNVQTIVVHALLIFVPLYLSKIKEFKVEIKNIWKPLVGFIGVGSISMTASQFCGATFAYSLRCNLLESVGLNIPFPWHLLVVFGIVYVLTIILYVAFGIRKRHTETMEIKKTFLSKLLKFVAIVGGVLFVCLIPYLAFGSTPILNYSAFICLFPILFTTILLIISEKPNKQKLAK
ncbi:MAG: hypothetical protein WCR30_01825 [Clostridia bacterium]